MADFAQDTSGSVGVPQTSDGSLTPDASGNLQPGAFGGIPYGQQSESLDVLSQSVGTDDSGVDSFPISADDIPDFSDDSQSVLPTSLQMELSDVGFKENVSDSAIPSSDPSVSVVDPFGGSSDFSSFDEQSPDNIPPSQALQASGVVSDLVSTSGVSPSGGQDLPTADVVEAFDDSSALEDVHDGQESTVYDQVRSVEERDLERDDNPSSLVDKFYELATLIGKSLDLSADHTFSLLAHDTDEEHVEYRFVRVKNVDAGFKIEKLISNKLTNDIETVILTMTYKVSFSSLRLYINGTMLYQEVKGDDQGDENRAIILDKINKFLLLVGEYYANLQQKKEQMEEKKRLSVSLRSF